MNLVSKQPKKALPEALMKANYDVVLSKHIWILLLAAMPEELRPVEVLLLQFLEDLDLLRLKLTSNLTVVFLLLI